MIDRTLKHTRVQIGVRDIADLALVSIGTVSRVLNNHPNVEADLRLRVLDAVNKLGYVHHPRQTDRFLREVSEPDEGPNNKVQQITFCYRAGISPSFTAEMGNTYFPLVLQGAEMACRQQNLHLRYRIIEDDAKELPMARRALSDSQAQALLLVNFVDHELVNGLLELKLPAVLVDHYFSDLPLDAVMNDSYYGAFQAVQHLIKNGHRKIAFVSGLSHYTILRRFDGYCRALNVADITYDPAWLLTGDLTVESGVEAAHEFVRRKLDCTAIFCANDNTAFGVIQGLAQSGLQVPADISVMGFDDVEAARLVTPPLTTIRANAPALGRMAIRKLLERIYEPDLPITQTLVRSELIERRSVRTIA